MAPSYVRSPCALSIFAEYSGDNILSSTLGSYSKKYLGVQISMLQGKKKSELHSMYLGLIPGYLTLLPRFLVQFRDFRKVFQYVSMKIPMIVKNIYNYFGLHMSTVHQRILSFCSAFGTESVKDAYASGLVTCASKLDFKVL
jgi:hypothetical protein